MKLFRERFLNPFFVEINNKRHEIGNIIFFDKSGTICQTGQGWFDNKWGGSNNHLEDGFEIPTNCTLKRKVDFSSDSAFIIKQCDDHISVARYDLYIPAAVVGLKQPTAKKPHTNARYYVISWESDIDGIIIDKGEWIDGALCPIEKRINEIGETISKPYNDFDQLPEMIKELQQLEKQREKALIEMEQVTPEQVLQHYKKA